MSSSYINDTGTKLLSLIVGLRKDFNLLAINLSNKIPAAVEMFRTVPTTASYSNEILLSAISTATIAVPFTADGSGVVTSNNTISANVNSAVSFTGQIIAKQASTNNVATWSISGAVVVGGALATIAFVGTPTITVISNVPGWPTPTISLNVTTGSVVLGTPVITTGPVTFTASVHGPGITGY